MDARLRLDKIHSVIDNVQAKEKAEITVDNVLNITPICLLNFSLHSC